MKLFGRKNAIRHFRAVEFLFHLSVPARKRFSVASGSQRRIQNDPAYPCFHAGVNRVAFELNQLADG
jgi:hypothetical protein